MQRVLIVMLALVVAAWVGCAPAEKVNEDNADQSVSFPLLVDSDQIFGFTSGSEIGDLHFSDSKGLVGSRIKCNLKLDDWDRFQDTTLAGSIVLNNTDATKVDEYAEYFEVTSDETEVYFYIPQIKSVPTVLNFTFTLYFSEETDTGSLHEFIAKQDYQFEVDQGQPAT